MAKQGRETVDTLEGARFGALEQGATEVPCM